MAMTRAEIQKHSDEKLGIQKKTFALYKTTVHLIKQLSELTGFSQTQVLTKIAEEFAARYYTDLLSLKKEMNTH